MSTRLLPEVVLEIGANPVSFYSGGGGWGSAPGLCWASAPSTRYRLTLCALTMRVHPTFFDLATPLAGVNVE